MATTTLRLPQHVYDRLRAVAVDRDQSVNTTMVEALTEWLAQRDAQTFVATVDEFIERHARLIERLADS